WFSSPGASGSPPGQVEAIEVTSQLLTYRQIDGTVVYSGDVRVEQARRVIACRELSVELDGSGHEAKRMICREDVRLDDPANNRQVLGDTAVYSLDSERVEVFGDTVRLIDSQNNRLEGRYLLYDLVAGTVQIHSRARAQPSPVAGSK
ncbi:MAG: hypothetical protein GY725_21995, partial [bacterium]|nr:hypothetical protein [bacterium]